MVRLLIDFWVCNSSMLIGCYHISQTEQQTLAEWGTQGSVWYLSYPQLWLCVVCGVTCLLSGGDLFIVWGWPVCSLGVTLRCSLWVRWHSNRRDTVTQCNLPWGRCIDLWIIYALLTLKQLYWIIDVCLCVPIIITVCRDLNNQRLQKTCGISLMESCLFSNNWLTEWSFTVI